MDTKNLHRTVAAAAVAALLAAGAGVAAIGTGAIALGGATGGAAIVTHVPGKLTVKLTSDETQRAAYKAGYAEDLCSGDVWLSPAGLCAATVKHCALERAEDKTPVLVTMFTSGRELGCDAA